MEVRIYIQPKPGILDPQGSAVAAALRHLGFSVTDTRVGKEIIVTVDANSAGEALSMANEMCRKLLANPVTENFRCVPEEQ